MVGAVKRERAIDVLKEFRDFCKTHGYMPALAPQPGKPDYAWKDAALFRKFEELERRIGALTRPGGTP